MERLQPIGKIEKEERKQPLASTLGYRGMLIEQIGEPVKSLPKTFRIANGMLFGPDLAHHPKDKTFEEYVCGSTHIKELKELGPEPPKLILGELREYVKIFDRWKGIKFVWPIEKPCTCGPIYEPTWWNVPSTQPYNNCYNYATNYRTNTFAQPGRAAGNMYNAITCDEVKAGAISDESIDASDNNNKCPDEGHLVALVIWPNWDYHWYRKGQNEYWSHKPGGTAVTNLDNDGNTISDPRTANRGGYTVFCTFMVVKHGHIKIS